MQLDIFEHSRDVILRNAVIDALHQRKAGECARARATLAAEYGADPLLPEFGLLCSRLRSPLPAAPERQGRHAELVEGRRKLRAAHPALFARYMQSR